MLALLLTAAALLAQEPPAGETRRFTLAPGEEIAATTYGRGDRTIVIVPGVVGGAFGFRRVTPQLVAAGRRVIVVDMLGTGASSKPARADYSLTAQAGRVGDVLDSLRVREAVFLAHAVAGSIVYRLALHRPRLVRAIVGIDAGASERAATSGLRRAMRFAPLIKLIGARRILVGKVKDGLIESSSDPAWVTQGVIDGYAAPYRENAGQMLRVLQAMAGAPEPAELTPNLGKIRTRVTLMVGTKPPDKVLSADKIELLRAGLPNFRLETVPGVGVFIQEERPEAVVRVLLAAGTGGDTPR